MDTKKLTISLIMPIDLLARVDALAKRSYATRSDILRQAALTYVRQSNLDDDALKRQSGHIDQRPKKKQKPPEPERNHDQTVKKLQSKHPYAHLYDKELLVFLDDYEQGKL